MAAYGVDLVIDVGANSGQYASGLRAAGYAGRIVSFEPLSEPYGRLAAASSRDADWDCRQLALGRRPGTTTINVSEDSRNSSIFAVGDRHLQAVPDSRLVGMETVRIDQLDRLWPAIARDAHRPYLKKDMQGSELDALLGVLDDTETGEMLQADGTFRRVDRIDPGRD